MSTAQWMTREELHAELAASLERLMVRRYFEAIAQVMLDFERNMAGVVPRALAFHPTPARKAGSMVWGGELVFMDMAPATPVTPLFSPGALNGNGERTPEEQPLSHNPSHSP